MNIEKLKIKLKNLKQYAHLSDKELADIIKDLPHKALLKEIKSQLRTYKNWRDEILKKQDLSLSNELIAFNTEIVKLQILLNEENEK